MAVQGHPLQRAWFHLPTRHASGSAHASVEAEVSVTLTGASSAVARRIVAGVRLLLGFVFLWAFFDKLFGWHYATASGKGWIDGGSPTKGFLGGVAAGPMASTFHSWAGAGWADWLFMLGLLGIGLALVSGVALRLAAVAGTALMALMWMAEWPLAQHLSTGAPSLSSNPIVDYHVIYAIVMIALAALSAGTTWGLGRVWARLPFVDRNKWLL
jgi:thiosulfate dehydrogenase [quinone] large subunit